MRTPDTGPSDVTLIWLQWIHDRKSFEDARDHCVTLGGSLFHDLNGTVEQLQLLWSKTDKRPTDWGGFDSYFIGGTRRNDGQWVGVNGEVFDPDNLIWYPGEPDANGDSMGAWSYRDVYGLANTDSPSGFICDMLTT